MTRAEQIAQVDHERREREAECAALLLLLLAQAYRHAVYALKIDCEPPRAAGKVLRGDERTQQAGFGHYLTPLLIGAWLFGYRRTGLIAGVRNHDVSPDTLAAQFETTAARATNDLATKVETVVTASVDQGGTVRERIDRLKADFGKAGWLADVKPFAVDRLAQQLSYGAYNAGWWTGWHAEAGQDVEGFEYVAIEDEKTSETCHAYNHVRLPKAHPWWLSHWPGNHHWCRSVVWPYSGTLWTPESDIPYTPAPTPGFGAAPAYVFR